MLRSVTTNMGAEVSTCRLEARIKDLQVSSRFLCCRLRASKPRSIYSLCCLIWRPRTRKLSALIYTSIAERLTYTCQRSNRDICKHIHYHDWMIIRIITQGSFARFILANQISILIIQRLEQIVSPEELLPYLCPREYSMTCNPCYRELFIHDAGCFDSLASTSMHDANLRSFVAGAINRCSETCHKSCR